MPPPTFNYPTEAKYRLGTVLAQVANLRGHIATRRWGAAYRAADVLDTLLDDANLTAIRRPDDPTGIA